MRKLLGMVTHYERQGVPDHGQQLDDEAYERENEALQLCDTKHISRPLRSSLQQDWASAYSVCHVAEHSNSEGAMPEQCSSWHRRVMTVPSCIGSCVP